MNEDKLKTAAKKIMEENELDSMSIIYTKESKLLFYTYGDLYSMSMASLSLFEDILKTIDAEKKVKDGKLSDKNGVWERLFKINDLVKELKELGKGNDK
jgi:hypothetical protein